MVFNAEKMKSSMGEEEFSLIVDAILNGKYSWACVLILKNAGYEPVHYIPYRTLNRLIKENGFPACAPSKGGQARNLRSHRSATPRRTASSIRDLSYLELSARESKEIKGGYFAAWAHIDSRLLMS